jgi:hypothetical protein
MISSVATPTPEKIRPSVTLSSSIYPPRLSNIPQVSTFFDAHNAFISQSIFWGLEVLSDDQSTNQLIPDQSHDQDSCLFWSPKTHSSQDQNTLLDHQN